MNNKFFDLIKGAKKYDEALSECENLEQIHFRIACQQHIKQEPHHSSRNHWRTSDNVLLVNDGTEDKLIFREGIGRRPLKQH